MQRSRNSQLAQETGYSGKVRIGNSGAVIALRVCGIITQYRHGPFPIPETHQRNHRINNAFRFGANRRVHRRRPACGADLAVRPKDAPVRRDLIDASLAQADVRHRLRPRQGFAHSPLQISDDLALKATGELARIKAGLLEDALGGEIAVWRVVLVQGVDGDAPWRCSSRAGERGPESVTSLFGDADPIDGTEHDRLP